MQTPKGRSGSSEAPQKVRPRAVCQLKTTRLESDSTSSSNRIRTPKERSPKIIERRSSRSPVTEEPTIIRKSVTGTVATEFSAKQKKRPSRICELESQISQLQEDLKKAKDQLSSSESWKNEAVEDAEESKKQLLTISSKLQETQKKLLERTNSEETRVIELQKISHERDQAWKSKLEAIHQQHSVNAASLASALGEIEQLKVQLEMVAESEDAQNKHTESANVELQTLKANLVDTLFLVDTMKNQLMDRKNSETEAQALASETLHQLETAKKSVEALRSDGSKAIEAYHSIASELEQSRARVKLLEGLVSKLEADLYNASRTSYQDYANDLDTEGAIDKNQNSQEANQIEAEVCSLKSEVEQLRTALEAAERKCNEEQVHNTMQINDAYELLEKVKSRSLLREAELEAELKQAKDKVEELKADLMDKETELQGISEENYDLNMKLKKSLSCQGESEIETEVKMMKEKITELKASLMDKETELQYISEENEILKAELGKKETDRNKVAVVELKAARAAEREALTKLGFMMEEADRSSKTLARVTEQLEASQASNSEMEAELRRIKVQSDQWRKAAEAAAAMLTSGNDGNFFDRTGSVDNYNPLLGKMDTHYNEDMEDDMLRKKNGNMLKKIGVLWKKTM